jgi:CheY-like chemotaxis protein
MREIEIKAYQILVIEDNPADAALIRIYLEEVALPSNLLHATHLKNGLQLLHEQDVDLVLLDLTLPDSDRRHTLKRFLEQAPEIPVIAMTGYKDEILGIQSVRAGAQDFLVKGEFDGKELARSIKYSLQRYNQQSKLMRTAKALSLDQEDYRDVQQMAKIANWDMDIVTNTMKWTEDMFKMLEIQQPYFQPTLADFLNLVHPEDREAVERFFATAIKDGEVHRIRHRTLLNNRTLKYLALQARVKYDALNDRIRLIGSIQDITEHRLNKNAPSVPELRARSTKMEQSMLKKTALLQLWQLQSVVHTLMEEIKERPASDLRDHGVQHPMIQPLNNLLYSICQLFHLSQVFPGTPITLEEKEIAFKEPLNRFQNLVTLTRHAGQSVQLHLEPNLPQRVIGDEERIQHLLLTLFRLPQASASRLIHFDVYVGVRSIRENLVILQININCLGPTPNLENLETLMQSNNLEQLILDQRAEEWSTILALAGKIARELNGMFQYRDKGRKGCQVELEFPLKTVPDPESAIDDLASPLRVLLVEDHVINQISIREMLTDQGLNVRVEVARNGREGVAMFRKKRYDLILMDLHMPVMEGIEAAGLIRKIDDRAPIIAMTTQTSAEEKARCLDAGMNDYLTKPFTPGDLFDKILKLTGRN